MQEVRSRKQLYATSFNILAFLDSMYIHTHTLAHTHNIYTASGNVIRVCVFFYGCNSDVCRHSVLMIFIPFTDTGVPGSDDELNRCVGCMSVSASVKIGHPCKCKPMWCFECEYVRYSHQLWCEDSSEGGIRGYEGTHPGVHLS